MSDAPHPTGLNVHLERVISAPPERVFAAFDAPQFRSWFGPKGFTVPRIEFDLVEGTEYRLAMQPPEGEVFHIRGTFEAVDAPRRLAYTFVYEEPDPDDQETLVTLTFEPTGPGTRLVLNHGPFKTESRRQLHHAGWTETLDRLGQSLHAPDPITDR
jgi:uncharacterized protein YndB with AHSA1/START domain